MLMAAHKHIELLSRFTRASLELFGSPADGKHLRTRDDTSDIYTYSLQTTCFDDLFFDDRFDDFFLDDRLVYKAHIESSKTATKPTRRGRAHGRPPEPDHSELCISDHHDTSATSSRVLKGSEPETTNVDTDRIPFLPSICSSPVLEFGSLKSAIATDPADLLCPPPFTPTKPPRDGAHETRVPDA